MEQGKEKDKDTEMSMGTELDYLLEWVESLQDKVREVVAEWEGREGNLIMILHAIQNEFGYLPRGVANELAKEMGISLARIYEVITFYNYFRLEPPGEHRIQVCTGTACYLKGSAELYEEIERHLSVRGGAEGDFQVETVRCIGCCGMAPAIVVDGETHGRLIRQEVAGVLREKRKGGQL
ncbi:MAG: NAD(P)H-dependent oxidoreductase subunit E [Oceanipulchritudo sp.]